MAGSFNGKPTRSGFWRRIQGQLILLLMVLLVPVLLVQIHVFYDRYKWTRQMELQSNLEIARAVAQSFETFVADLLHQELSIGLALTSSRALTGEDLNRVLSGSKAGNPAVWELFFARPDGIVTAATGPRFIGMNLGDRQYFQEIVAGRDWAVSDLLLSRTSKKPSFTISRGIRSETGQLLAIVVAGILPEQLDHVLGIERSKGGGIALVDRKGMLVFRCPSINPTWEQRNWLRDYPEFNEVLTEGKEISKTVFAPYEGKNRLVSFTPVSSWGWAATAGRTEEIAMEGVTSQIVPQAIFFMLVTLAAFGTAVVFSRFISSPVKRLRDQAMALGRGESHASALISGPAEIQDLAGSFNEMSVELRSRESALREQREWLQVTLSSIGDAVIAADESGLVNFINPVASELTGWQAHEALGQPIKSIFRVIDEETRQPAEDIVERVLRQGCVVNLANHSALISRADREIPIEDSAAPIKDASGKVIGVVLVFHDTTEKRRALEALRDSEATLRAVLDQLPSGVTVRDARTGALILSNVQSREIMGPPVDSLEQFAQYRGFHPDGRQYRTEDWPVYRSMATGEVVTAEEIACEGSDGVRITLSISSAPVRDSQGRIIMGVGIFHDITERKQTEKLLSQAHEFNRAILDTVDGLIIVLDRRGNIVRFNAACERLTGWRADEVTGRCFWELLVPEEQRAGVVKTFNGLASGMFPNRHENDWVLRDGSRRWVTWANSAFLDVEGGVEYVIGTGIDITERKRAEEALGEARTRLSVIVDSIADGFYALDSELKFTHINDAALSYFGRNRDEIIGKSLLEVFPRVPGTIFETSYRRAMQRGSPEHFETLSVVTGRAVEMHAYPGPGNLTVLFRDITDRKKMEEELQRSKDELELRVRERTAELERSNQALQDFASIASHDMQEPLRKVISFGNLLQQKHKESLGETGNDYLNRMLDATRRMQSLLTSLLEYSRVTTTMEPFKEVNLRETIDEVLSDLEARIQQSGANVHVGELPTVMADSTQIRQLLQNLIGNALKFHKSGEKPIVRVSSTSADSAWCEIIVEDDGIGFEERYLDKIFAPFQRLHGRSSKYEGTGMGLAICKKIVERHGGSITARSQPGQGSVFVITLPVGQKADRPGVDPDAEIRPSCS